MSKYNQPFCIIGSVGKFAPCYKGYLPPIEIDYEEIYDKQWAELQRRFGERVLVVEQESNHPCPIPREKLYRETSPRKEQSWQGFRI